MHKHLQRHRQMALDQLLLQTFQIRQGQLAGQDHPFTAQRRRLGHAGSTGDRHLRGSMQRQIRHQAARQSAETHVLNDHGVHPSPIRSQQQGRGTVEFVAEHQHVEGEETPHLALVQPMHQLRQLRDAEVLGPLARIERIHTEIHRIGPTGHGRLERSPVTGRCEQFGNAQELRRVKRRAASNFLSASAVPSKRQCHGSYITPCWLPRGNESTK